MASPGIALIAGLGNPGARYVATRHNAGFQFIARLQAETGLTLAREKRFNAEVGRLPGAAARAGTDGNPAVRVILPATFMNLSGQAIAPLASFYRIPPAQILVVHDELDLAPGVARLKRGGGHGGHNGLRDLIARLGGGDFLRLRIGIGHPGPGGKQEVSSYVLGKPDPAERARIDSAIDRALQVLDTVLGGDVDAAMHKLHTETTGETVAETAAETAPTVKPAAGDA
ncbi:MAG: aminoacyl-tRNA hydrolase [Gammaproteobacteria bacterium]|nr:aminoacyl-tRNA hydrolase [Gammaproteobacteria bacterium]